MEIVIPIAIVAVLLLLAILATKDQPKCEVCEAPIYSTKVGYRHKPGHAPGDGHKAVLLDKKKDS